MLVLTSSVILLVIVAVTARRNGATNQAQAILDRRLAAGEIDDTGHRERTAPLTHQAQDADRGPRRAIIGSVAAVALLVIVLVVALAALTPMGPWAPMGGHLPMGDHMGGMMGPPTTAGRSAPDPVEDAAELTVEAGDMYFAPAGLEITAGEPVNLTITNRGEVFHDLVVDELDLRLAVDPGDTTTAGLQVDQAGTYEFYCSVPGHAAAGMRGTHPGHRPRVAVTRPAHDRGHTPKDCRVRLDST